MNKHSKADARKNEILDVAEGLFIEKGYEHTTINDILEKSGVAKGSLYYYFKSKEDVLDGLIKRRGDVYIATAGAIARDGNSGAREKLIRIMFSLQPSDVRQQKLTKDLEKSSNGQMFLKSLADIVLRIAPVIRDVIDQGVKEGVFQTMFPLESAQILLAAAHTLFDNGDFTWTPDEESRIITAFLTAVERTLGADEHSLLALSQAFLSQRDGRNG